MILDIVMPAWFFLTPVFYFIDVLPHSYVLFGLTLDLQRFMHILNPMASRISTYRDLLYWGYRTDIDFFTRTAVTALAVLIFGFWFCVRHSARLIEEI